MSTRASSAASHLVALGFSEIESDAYIFLLRESPATGYRVAQGIDRTAANTYKAMESLEARGAVMVEEASPRLYRAVPLAELLANIEKTFQRHRDHAAKLLAKVQGGEEDDRVYHLRDPGQVIERCLAILAAARHVALLDIFPGPLATLRPAVDDCITRRVRVGILVVEPVAIEGATVIVNHNAEQVRRRWPSNWINVAADSSQQIHALLTPDSNDVVHATWSASPFLAHLYQSGLLGELLASAIRTAVREGKSRNEIEAIVHDVSRLEHTDTPAFAALTAPPLRRSWARGKGSP